MAYGLPVEGSDGPFLGDHLHEAATCDVGLTVADVRRLLDGSAGGTLVVVAGDGLAVGEVDGATLEGHDDGDRLLDVMDPVPTTVRPSVTVESVAHSDGGRQLVTTSDGRLLGVATVEAHDHDDHEGHDHGEGQDHEAEAYEQEMDRVLEAIGAHFGEREPSEEELRAFLRDRMLAEGRSPEEAARFLEELESGEDG